MRDFLNNEVKPSAILITGDVTDSAHNAGFEMARTWLDSLAPQPPPQGDKHKFRIVAGNHDRYLYRGTNPPIGLGWLCRRRWPRDKASRFNLAFPGALHVTSDSYCDMVLNAGGTPWLIRVIGFDSSAEPEWFAQGSVSNIDIESACAHAAGAVPHDLVIALVHHHILPIPSVEKSKLSGGMKKLLDSTGMLNSGHLMEALSRNQVNIVLHGHEHASHQARFAGSDDLAANVALIGAGSATGDATMRGWDLNRVHFNVIELDDDRSVWLRQVSADRGELAYRPERKLILDRNAVRRSNFVRRSRSKREPGGIQRKLSTSRLRKQVVFRANRDIELTECKTNRWLDDTWVLDTRSGSGTLGPALLQVDWDDREREAFSVVAQSIPSIADEFRFRQDLLHGNRTAARVTATWVWEGAAAFTETELKMLRNCIATSPRCEGREFTSVQCLPDDDLEELVLAVRVPTLFAPAPEHVAAYCETPENPGAQEYKKELQPGLDFCGAGSFELRVKYPLPGYRYGISWPVSQVETCSDAAAQFTLLLKEHSLAITSAMARLLAAQGWLERTRWALYLPDGPAPGHLRRLVREHDDSPDLFLLNDARGLARMAFWGTAALGSNDGNNSRYDVLESESVVGYFALREGRQLTHQALALLRIAFTDDPLRSIQGDAKVREWTAAFKSFATLATLTIASVARGDPSL